MLCLLCFQQLLCLAHADHQVGLFVCQQRIAEFGSISLRCLCPFTLLLQEGTVLLPALRLGYLVVPLALVDTFVQARSIADRHSPSLDQLILTEFINEGHFARHIRRMKQLYVERQAVLIEAARQKLDGLLQIQPSTTGLHVVGWLPPRWDDRLASQHIQRQGVDTPPLSAYHLALPQRSGLVLGYAGVEPQAIRTAVEHIARALS